MNYKIHAIIIGYKSNGSSKKKVAYFKSRVFQSIINKQLIEVPAIRNPVTPSLPPEAIVKDKKSKAYKSK